MTFDGSAIEGYSRVQETDVLARPDPNTFELLPVARTTTRPSARMFCDIAAPRRRAVRRRPPLGAEAQPRAGPGEGLHVLRRARDGVLLLPSRPSTPEPLDTAGYFDLTTADVGSATCASGRSCTLEAMGIPVEY